MEVGDLVKITTFDDGNTHLKDMLNMWRIVGFKFNKTKSLIIQVNWIENRPWGKREPLVARSISSWKLQKISYPLPE